jgi:putative protease
MAEEEIGKVSDFFTRPVVAAIELTGRLRAGDRLRIKGHTTDIELTADSIQVDNVNVIEANDGQAVGLKVSDRVRRGDTVYRISG